MIIEIEKRTYLSQILMIFLRDIRARIGSSRNPNILHECNRKINVDDYDTARRLKSKKRPSFPPLVLRKRLLTGYFLRS